MAQADAVLHFGTHGSLEFMPGKQVGMSGVCYPDSLIGSIPNFYYYAANNPSEATIAKRRSYANTISYLTPPAENAGLYKGLKVPPPPPPLVQCSLVCSMWVSVTQWRGLQEHANASSCLSSLELLYSIAQRQFARCSRGSVVVLMPVGHCSATVTGTLHR